MPEGGPFEEENLTVRDHLDPDKHWVGEALAPPSVNEATFAGVETAVGDSPFVSRADHSHDTRTRFSVYSHVAFKALALGVTTYVDGWVHTGGENWFAPSSSQLIVFPQEGIYLVTMRYTITRSGGGTFPTTIQRLIKFEYRNGVSVHEVMLGNVPQSRSKESEMINETVHFGTIASTSNWQLSILNTDAIQWDFRCQFLGFYRLSSSFGVDTS